MGVITTTTSAQEESTLSLLPPKHPSPKDTFHFAYIIYFTLGLGFLLPWNTFITAVDYFSYLYPTQNVDRVFSVAYMLVGLVVLVIIIFNTRKSDSTFVRINAGLVLFVGVLLVVPVMDLVFVKGVSGLNVGFYITVGVLGLCGVADAFVQSGLYGSAGELPERYMQAVVAGTAASGVLVSFLRIFTKAVFPQDVNGLRYSAILYFIVGILIMIVCLVLYNLAHRLPIIKYYSELKVLAQKEEQEETGALTGPVWEIMGTIKWHGIGILIIYIVTLSIFPGFITEDVSSESLGDWYPILLITSYNIFDLVGKCFTAVYFLENANVAVVACFARLLFYPLFLGCLHGPQFLRTEIPVTVLTGLLGLTNGYLTSVLMILAPKTVQLQHSETAGILIVLFLVVGMASGSVVSWFWVI